MRITIVQGAFLPVPPLMGGAVEKMWFLLGQAFARQGHTVTHISRLYHDLPVEEDVAGVKYLRVKGYNTPANGVVLKGLDLVYSLRAKKRLPAADILVTHTFWMPILVRNHKRGHVFVDVQRMPKGQMLLYRKAARLRANSTPVERAILADDRRSEGRTIMIPNPLSFTPRQEPDWRAKENEFLYVGRLHPEKGIEVLLESFARFKQETKSAWRLRLVGPYETSHGGGGRKWKEALEGRYAKAHDIEWIEPIFDTEKLNAEYLRAKVFVYPSLAEKGETFGLAVLEAMAWGCLPLVSDLACFKDFIRDRMNGYIFSHREDPIRDLTGTLGKLAYLPEDQMLSIGRKACEVRHTHSVERIANEFLAEFEKMI